VIIAFIWGLHILGVNTTAVLAGAGIIGLIIGFGAQSLIEDIITGLFIIFEKQYKIGDIIVLDDFRGTVRSIGVRTTTIEDAGGNLKIVNNSDIRNLQNRSANKSVALCDVAVAYSTDLRRLEEVVSIALPKMYEGHEDLYLSAPRYLGVEQLADSGINLRFMVDVKEENIFMAQRQLRRDIKILFDEAGINIPFPQVVVHQG
jgi:small conductance mechanosensitive channel